MLGLLPATALAQSPINARADRASIALDEQVLLTVTVTGNFLTIPQPDLTAITDFVVQSSGTSTQVSIVNGKMTSQGIFTYQLQPLNEGTAVIAPITINIDGQVYQTDPINIEILPAGTQTAPSAETPPSENSDTLEGQEFFVEAAVNNPNPYLGEQVIYTLRFYQATNTFGNLDARPPSFTDFWSQKILVQPSYNVDVAGRQYLVTEFLTALFPANLGQLTIAPYELVIPRGLFNPDLRLATEAIDLAVKPWPENSPADFNGAVGQYQIRASLNTPESKVNEPLTLSVEISGAGNIEKITEPAMPDMPNWRLFESQSQVRLDSSQTQVQGVRTFERLIVPGQAGPQEIPPIRFSYFDPQSGAYQTISTAPIPVNIVPDDSSQPLPLAAAPPSSQQSVNLLASDIVHIKPVPYILSTPAVVSAVGRVLYWGLWLAPLLVMGGALVWKQRRVRLIRNPAYARSLRAKKVALRTLTEAQQPQADGAAIAGRALLGYLADKLDTPTTGLTLDVLVKLLREDGVDTALSVRVHDVLLQVDFGRFAPIAAGDAQVLISETRLLINELERFFEGGQ
jgi:hypothetical protein